MAKRKEDEQMALITKETGRPEPIANRAELMAKAKGLIAGGMSQRQAAKELGIVEKTLSGWLTREKKRNEKTKAKYEEILDSVDAVQPIRSMGCVEPELSDKATEVITAPIGVEVPQYDPSDNDFADDEPIPVVKPEPIDAQIDIMIDLYLADRKAKLKAHLKSLMADPEVMDAIKAMIGMGLIA